MADSAISVIESTARILAAHPPVHSVSLRFETCRIEARSNSKQVIERLIAYYEGFVAEASPPAIVVNAIETTAPVFNCPFTPQPRAAGKQPKEEFFDASDGRIVHKVRTGMVFLFGPATHLAVGPCGSNLNQVINFINNRHIAWGLNRRRLLLHAAGVCEGQNGLGLAGVAGAGKSTLALHLLDHGLSFVSNDRLLASRDERELTMVGLAKMPRVNPGTILHNPRLESILPASRREELRKLPEPELWELEEKYDVSIRRVYGTGRFVLRSPLRGLVVLTWNRAGGPVVVREGSLRQRGDLLPAIMKSPGVFYPQVGQSGTYDHNLDDYQTVLGECPGLEITGGISFADAADHCRAFLHRHSIYNHGSAPHEQSE